MNTNTKIIFTGELVALPSPMPRCGDDAIAGVFKFNVQQVHSGNLQNKVAYVVIPCPELKGSSFFAAGGNYKIEATTDLSEMGRYTLVNDYQDEKPLLIWCLEIAKSPLGSTAKNNL